MNNTRLNKWNEEIGQRLTYLFGEFDREMQNKLDFSPKSLNFIEQKILDRFTDYKDYRNKKLDNLPFLEAAATYVGEVFIRNEKIRDLEWYVQPQDKDGESISLYCEIYKTDVPIFSKFLPLTNFRTGHELYDYFKKNTAYYEEHGEEKLRMLKEAVPVEDKGYSYQHFILIKDESFDLQEVETQVSGLFDRLKKNIKLSMPNDGKLTIKMEDGYEFHFLMDKGDHVAEESKEIAEDYKGEKDKESIAACKSRIEFWGDEDSNAEYINEYMFILDKLNATGKVFAFDFKNGIFYDEN